MYKEENIMKIGLKVTITGLCIQMLRSGVVGSLEKSSPVGNVILFITAIALCVVGIIITFFEIPENPVIGIISEIAQVAGSICLLTNIGLAESAGNVVLGILVIYGLFQALIHWNPIYVIYIFW